MALVSGKCTTCGGEIQLDDTKAEGFCLHCGSKVFVEQAISKVQVDSGHLVVNYLKMAENAYDSQNNTEAEAYCNKILEVEPSNPNAWYLKGKAAGWQSTLKDNRFKEAVNCFSKSIIYSPIEEKHDYVDKVINAFVSLTTALIETRSGFYKQYPDGDSALQLSGDVLTVLESRTEMLKQCEDLFAEDTDLLLKFTDVYDLQKVVLADMLYIVAQEAWIYTILPEYQEADDGRPGDYAWNKFLDRADGAISLITTAVSLGDPNKNNLTSMYKTLIEYQEVVIASCSWDWDYWSDGTRRYKQKLVLTIDAIVARRMEIEEYHAKIAEIDPDYVKPEPAPEPKSGCYIATAVYGSYDSEEVLVFRKFRDKVLATSGIGVSLIRFYYRYSPPLANRLRNAKYLNRAVKIFLDNLVKFIDIYMK